MKLTIAQQKALPRTVWFEGSHQKAWVGKSDGIIKDGCLLVYQAAGVNPKSNKPRFTKRQGTFIPLTRVFEF